MQRYRDSFEYLDQKQLKAERDGVFYTEKVFYRPEWIALDTVIDGAQEVMKRLVRKRAIIFSS
jgi:hypothetical protein